MDGFWLSAGQWMVALGRVSLQASVLILRCVAGGKPFDSAPAYALDGGVLTLSTVGVLRQTTDDAAAEHWLPAATTLTAGATRTLAFPVAGKLADIREGQEALVRFEDAVKSRGRGRVLWISRQANAATQMLTVRVDLDNPAARPAGQNVRVGFPPTSSSGPATTR